MRVHAHAQHTYTHTHKHTHTHTHIHIHTQSWEWGNNPLEIVAFGMRKHAQLHQHTSPCNLSSSTPFPPPAPPAPATPLRGTSRKRNPPQAVWTLPHVRSRVCVPRHRNVGVRLCYRGARSLIHKDGQNRQCGCAIAMPVSTLVSAIPPALWRCIPPALLRCVRAPPGARGPGLVWHLYFARWLSLFAMDMQTHENTGNGAQEHTGTRRTTVTQPHRRPHTNLFTCSGCTLQDATPRMPRTFPDATHPPGRHAQDATHPGSMTPRTLQDATPPYPRGFRGRARGFRVHNFGSHGGFGGFISRGLS